MSTNRECNTDTTFHMADVEDESERCSFLTDAELPVLKPINSFTALELSEMRLTLNITPDKLSQWDFVSCDESLVAKEQLYFSAVSDCKNNYLYLIHFIFV
jgi:hypothetical protein